MPMIILYVVIGFSWLVYLTAIEADIPVDARKFPTLAFIVGWGMIVLWPLHVIYLISVNLWRGLRRFIRYLNRKKL